MTRALIVVFALSAALCSVRGGGQPIKDAPSVICLSSGAELKVLSLTRTTLHESNEPAVAVQYVTAISFADTGRLYDEAEEVFERIRSLAERERVQAAVVMANEPAGGLISMSRGAGWCWKQRSDGSWRLPDENDKARVPK